ncbi:MAG: cytochrome c biogenesis protein CcsA [Actinomycetia bacterium]|nr:cytochrome c biogenesis protein CcsA [Actinomycetes bacterium]
MLFAELGLWLVVIVAGVGVVAPDQGRRYRLDIVAATIGTVLLIVLGGAFVVEAWSLAYVADHARSGLNPLLQVSGLWAGAEGSLLLWTTMVAWASVVARTMASRRPGRVELGVIRRGALLTGGYGLVLVLAASPFERLAIPPVDGLGLQPVLEHPAMIWHPPILYAGLSGLLIPALLAAAADGAVPPTFDRRVLTIPLGLLTIGLATGAVWANVELGWGGYWAWDPIESAGLVAWLLGAAALHGWPRQGSGPGSTLSPRVARAALIAPGLAAVWATTMTRIGVVDSVHAFADRPGLRIGLLTVAGVVTLGAIAAITTAGPGSPGPTPSPAPTTHRQWAVAGLAVAAVIVAIGTYEPLVEGATTGDRVAIAGHYYTRLLWPVVIIGAALAIKADRRWHAAVVGAAIGAVVTPFAAGPFAIALAIAGGGVAGSALSTLRARRPGALAHLGVGLVLVGIGGTVATEITIVDLVVDTPTMVDGFELTHRSIVITETGGTRQAIATLEVDGTIFEPRLVSFPLRGASTTEMARRLQGVDDVQVILIDGDASGARYRLNHLPRVGIVWLGCAVVAIGLTTQPLRRFRARSSDTVDAAAGSASEGSDDDLDIEAGARTGDSDGDSVGDSDGGFDGGVLGGSAEAPTD